MNNKINRKKKMLVATISCIFMLFSTGLIFFKVLNKEIGNHELWRVVFITSSFTVSILFSVLLIRQYIIESKKQ